MYLRKFKKSELLFNKKETKGILKFIFSGTPKTQIDAITVALLRNSMELNQEATI